VVSREESVHAIDVAEAERAAVVDRHVVARDQADQFERVARVSQHDAAARREREARSRNGRRRRVDRRA